MECHESFWGHEDPKTLDVVGQLGQHYLGQTKLTKAEKMCLREVQGREKTLGAKHPTTLKAATSLGLVYESEVDSGRPRRHTLGHLTDTRKPWDQRIRPRFAVSTILARSIKSRVGFRNLNVRSKLPSSVTKRLAARGAEKHSVSCRNSALFTNGKIGLRMQRGVSSRRVRAWKSWGQGIPRLSLPPIPWVSSTRDKRDHGKLRPHSRRPCKASTATGSCCPPTSASSISTPAIISRRCLFSRATQYRSIRGLSIPRKVPRS